VAITGVYTASPEWFETHSREEMIAYFEDCLRFHDETYGRAFNAVIHLDETTPHLQVISVPLIEDAQGMHLSAKLVMGGRDDYRKRQDQFFEQVGKPHEMERGERRDPAERKAHTTKREWQIATQEQRLEDATKQADQQERRAQKAAERADFAEERNRHAQQEAKEAKEATDAEIKNRQAKIAQATDHAQEQKLEALRERDEARAGRDVLSQLSQLSEAILSPKPVEVEILAQTEAKRTMTGREKPATVTISRDQLLTLQKQATVTRDAQRDAQAIQKALQDFQAAAELANRNRIDTQAIATQEAVRTAQRAQRAAEQGLERERSAHAQTRKKATLDAQRAAEEAQRAQDALKRDLEARLAQERSAHAQTRKELQELTDKADEMEEMWDSLSLARFYVGEKKFDAAFDALTLPAERVVEMHMAWDERDEDSPTVSFDDKEVPVRQFLQDYADEVHRHGFHIDPDMAEELEELKSLDQREVDGYFDALTDLGSGRIKPYIPRIEEDDSPSWDDEEPEL
jgi:hypothetical protein